MAEMMPPLTAGDVRIDLENRGFSVYIYLGSADDEAWDNAILVEALLPRFRSYLATSPDGVEEWVEDEETAAIVFGFVPDPVFDLDRAASDINVLE